MADSPNTTTLSSGEIYDLADRLATSARIASRDMRMAAAIIRNLLADSSIGPGIVVRVDAPDAVPFDRSADAPVSTRVAAVVADLRRREATDWSAEAASAIIAAVERFEPTAAAEIVAGRLRDAYRAGRLAEIAATEGR